MRLIDADELVNDFLNVCRTEFEVKNKCMTDENVLSIIQNAPTVEPDVNCSHCDYFKFSQLFVDNIAKLMADYNIETYDDLMNEINRVKDELKESDSVKPCSSCAHFNNGNLKPYPCGSCFTTTHNMWEGKE